LDLKNRQLALLLAWMVPGLGHFYQGRTGKGILYLVSILSLFVVGLALGDWRVVYWRWQNPIGNTETFCWPYLFQFWTGLAAFPAMIQATLVHYGHQPTLWSFMGVPSQMELNSLYPKGKFVEIGSLYTMVAGLLNVLAMFDAYEGPANQQEEGATPEAELVLAKSEVVEAGASL
jgi:TM2 domain-containing membrane protein YozV